MTKVSDILDPCLSLLLMETCSQWMNSANEKGVWVVSQQGLGVTKWHTRGFTFKQSFSVRNPEDCWSFLYQLGSVEPLLPIFVFLLSLSLSHKRLLSYHILFILSSGPSQHNSQDMQALVWCRIPHQISSIKLGGHNNDHVSNPSHRIHSA